MVDNNKWESERSYAELKSLLKTKSEAERQLNEISSAIKLLEKQSYQQGDNSFRIKELQKKEVEIGTIWTKASDAILQHETQSYREAALKILHLTNNLNSEDNNENAIKAIKDCALVLFRLENENANPIEF